VIWLFVYNSDVCVAALGEMDSCAEAEYTGSDDDDMPTFVDYG